MKLKVYLAQFSTMYGKSLFLPYSVGLLKAYVQKFELMQQHYTFGSLLVRREPIDVVLSRMETPSVLGLSVYQWNERYSLALAKAVKAEYPSCLIVMGGPQIPNEAGQFLQSYPYVDVVVHGEGEATFSEILHVALSKPPLKFDTVPGTSWLNGDGICIKAEPRYRFQDLSVIPSPYLTGVFDDLDTDDIEYQAVIEGHRGCPWQCSYCDWGSLTQSKVYAFDHERIKAEFEWCGRHKIRFAYSADANYGMLARDLELTQALVETKKRYGFPKEFRACTAKNAGDRVFEISTILNDAGMCKGATLSVQSLDPHTLQTIKRSNIKMDDFAYWMQRYHEAHIPTYSEVILGLPGETYETFTNGLDTLLNAGQHEHISIYLCQLLPNSEMSQPTYMVEHGIRSVRMPVLLQHSSPQVDDITEYHDIVIETSTMPQSDWERAYLFAWAVQTFHGMGLTRLLAMYLKDQHGVTYRQFYEGLLATAMGGNVNAIREQYYDARLVMKRALSGGSWDVVIPAYGNVIWPSEEASFLRLVCQKSSLIRDLVEVVRILGMVHGFWIEGELLEDLLRYQTFMVRDPYLPAIWHLEVDHNWHGYFAALQQGTPIEIIAGRYMLDVTSNRSYDGDLVEFAKHQVWFGRKSGAFLYTDVQEYEFA